MLQLRWLDNPKVVNVGDTLDVSLELENTGSDRAEFDEAGLVLFGQLLDEHGRSLVTEGYRLARPMPPISYRLDPGDVKTVHVFFPVSPDEQRSLPVGRYTVILPAHGYDNSVLTSIGADPPSPLTVEIRPSPDRGTG